MAQAALLFLIEHHSSAEDFVTTEVVLLLGLFAFLLLGAFMGDKGPRATFLRSGPKLAARIEKNVAIGHSFLINGDRNRWRRPPGNAPEGNF